MFKHALPIESTSVPEFKESEPARAIPFQDLKTNNASGQGFTNTKDVIYKVHIQKAGPDLKGTGIKGTLR